MRKGTKQYFRNRVQNFAVCMFQKLRHRISTTLRIIFLNGVGETCALKLNF